MGLLPKFHSGRLRRPTRCLLLRRFETTALARAHRRECMSLALSAKPDTEPHDPAAVIAPARRMPTGSGPRASPTAHLRLYWGVHVPPSVSSSGHHDDALVLFAIAFWGRLFGITAATTATSRTRPSRRAALPVRARAARHRCNQKGPLCGEPAPHPSPRVRRSRRRSFAEARFYYSHQGWIFDRRWQATRLDLIPDFAKYPRSSG